MAKNIVSSIYPSPWPVVVTDPAAPKSGDPVRFGALTGIALNDEGAGGAGSTETVVDFGWFVARHPVNDHGGSGITVGSMVYYVDSADRLENDATGTPYGVALDAVGASATTTIRVLHFPALTLGAAAVTKSHLVGGFSKIEKVAGQDETSDDTIPVAGLAAGDELVAVFVEDGTSGKWTQRALTDFTVGAAELTVKANKAVNTSNAYVVFWNDLT